MSVREARLKREGAAEYPGMPVERWMPAIELAPSSSSALGSAVKRVDMPAPLTPRTSIFAEATSYTRTIRV